MSGGKIIVDAYLEAWSSNVPVERRRLLDACWARDGTIEIDTRRFAGRGEVEQEIARFRAACPTARAELASDVDEVGCWLRFSARIVGADGSRYGEVLDVLERDSEGLIRRVLTFRPTTTG